MLIRCPTCASGYDIPPELLGNGRVLRCAHCRDAWAFRPAAAAVEIAAEVRSGRRAPAMRTDRDAPPQRRVRVLPRFGAGAAALAILAGTVASGMAAVAARQRVVAAFPPSAAVFATLGMPVNLRGLAIDALRATVETADGASILTLDGRIANRRRETTAVPALRIVVRDADGRDLYSWIASAPEPRLAPGEAVPFHAKLSTPPRDGRTLAVSFVDPAGSGPRHVADVTPSGR